MERQWFGHICCLKAYSQYCGLVLNLEVQSGLRGFRLMVTLQEYHSVNYYLQFNITKLVISC